MSDQFWLARHRIISGFLWSEVPVLLLVGVFGPMPVVETLLLPIVVGAFGVASMPAGSSRATSELTSLGLIGGSFIAIELSGGQLHAHLSILSAVALVALYQRWTPLLLTVGAIPRAPSFELGP